MLVRDGSVMRVGNALAICALFCGGTSIAF